MYIYLSIYLFRDADSYAYECYAVHMWIKPCWTILVRFVVRPLVRIHRTHELNLKFKSNILRTYKDTAYSSHFTISYGVAEDFQLYFISKSPKQ